MTGVSGDTKPSESSLIEGTTFQETNTDDLSPATHATTRPDIPLHALAMLETRVPEGLKIINSLKQKHVYRKDFLLIHVFIKD